MNIKENNNKEDFLLSSKEKKELKGKIFQSIHSLERKKKRLRFMAAASAIILLGIGMFYNQSPTESIIDYVNTSALLEENKNGKVILITGEGKAVNVEGVDSKITYSSTGDKVTIEEEQSIYQNALKKNAVVYNTLMVPFGKKSKIELSDGSKIWLNSGSRLVYPAVFKGGNREVYLEGEAIFEVVSDKKRPFLVVSEGQKIEVLGTVFNVSTYKNDKEVKTTLKSGSVDIEYLSQNLKKPKNRLKITPGTQATYNKADKRIVSETVNVDHYFSWRNNELVFKNDALQFIIRKLTRHYNVDIEINAPELAEETFSGNLDLKEDVEKVLRIIARTTDMEYTKISENQYVINKKELPMK
ncbi:MULTISPECIES: FecR family protein [Arenibacter]|uniref:FecR family protein n=1 Tax=Arenibacter TaxID=178469 RepID=UPI000A39E115|nr:MULTISPECIES: FecR domain-containing protein [Arenibacter]